MNTYYLWAEHGNGQSVDHCCVTGIFSDPTDCWSEVIEASNEQEAEKSGRKLLAAIVDQAEPCRCHRHLQAGSSAWWNSVSIIASRKPFPQYATDEDLAEQDD